jgi:Bacterial Ig-like domain
MRRKIILFISAGLLGACARQTTPGGGPKDKTPPHLLHAVPANNDRNYKGKTLTLTFDEAVKLKDAKNEIIITPVIKGNIDFTAIKNRVVITPKKGLLDSTTYSFSFRDAVQDITESNPAEDLRIAFSTGPDIDSLTISGSVKFATTEKTPEKITVAIFEQDTFNIFKHKPSYFSITDKKGNFILRNLHQGRYKIYAFDDKSKNLIVDSRSESYGFLAGKLNLEKNIDSLEIPLVRLDSRVLKLTNIRNSDRVSRIRFNKSLTKYSLHSAGGPMIHTFGDNNSEIKIFAGIPETDSLQIAVHAQDSLHQIIDTLVYVKRGPSSGQPEKFNADIREAFIDPEKGVFSAMLSFSKPTFLIDPDTIIVKIDSLTSFSIDSADMLYDTIQGLLRFKKKLDRKMVTELNTVPELYISAKSFVSIDNDTTKKMTKDVTVPSTEETGQLSINVETKQPHFEVQLLSLDYKISQSVKDTRKITFRQIPPAEYKIRIYIDDNNNSVWDYGNYLEDVPPERMIFFKNSKDETKFPIRANWEVGPYNVYF